MKNVYVLIISVFFVAVVTNSYSQAKKVNNNTKEIKMPVPVNLSAIEFKKMIDNEDAILLDVRTVREFMQGHIKGAINIDWYQGTFESKVAELDKTKKVLIYCRSGNRTGKAKYFMIGLGFTRIYNLEYGVNDWARNNFEFVK